MASMKDQRIILTGASEGIGRALAVRLAGEGARLILAARNAERLQSVVEECRELGAKAYAVPTDVTDPTACSELIRSAIAHFGDIDVLILNAGVTMWSRFDRITDHGVFEDLMRVNYLAPVRLTALALPYLRRTCGHVVAIASVAGITGVPERTAYAASKHALVGFAESLRIELKPAGVAVTVVAPDFVVSEIHKRAIGADGQALGASPLQNDRVMTAEECAKRIVRGIERRERLVLMSMRSRIGRWLRLVAPGTVDSIAARAIRNRR
jgi:short-subunit dehydrogenase